MIGFVNTNGCHSYHIGYVKTSVKHRNIIIMIYKVTTLIKNIASGVQEHVVDLLDLTKAPPNPWQLKMSAEKSVTRNL